VQVNPYNKSQLWLKHVTVDPVYRNQKIATLMIDSLFKYLASTSYELVRSSPSEMGQSFIQPIMQRYKEKYPNVVVYDIIR